MTLQPSLEHVAMGGEWLLSHEPLTSDVLPNDMATLLEQQAAAGPDRTFVEFIDTGTRLTYGELDRAANRFANGLHAAGLRAGDFVVVMLPNVAEMVVAQFGAYKASTPVVAINVEFRGAALARMINLTESVLLVVHAEFEAAVRDVWPELTRVKEILVVGESEVLAGLAPCRRFDEALSHDDAPPPRDLSPGSPSGIMFTSGTTGVSKGCVISHRYGVAAAAATARSLAMGSADTIYSPWPLHHMTAAYHELITTLIVGGRIVFRRRFSFTRFWPDVRECGATHLTLIGIVARLLETAPPDDRDRDNPLKVMTGGPLPADRAAFEERFGVVTVACYGGTDVGMPTYERIGDGDPPDSHGVVQGIFEVRIADDNDEQLHVGEVGEILVRPRLPHVTSSGYFGMPQATVDTWRDLWFHTGDLGRFDAAGRLYFLGRKKEMIRRSGENISIFEVEEALIAHPAIAEAAVIAVPAELGEDEIVAFVSLKDGAELDEAELRAFCNANMGRFMVPQYIRFLAEIPRTPTGKYAMSALQAIFTSQ